MDLDLATVLAGWAAGGLAFGWVTGRHGLLGPGYAWLLRGIYGALAAGSALAALAGDLPGWHRVALAAGAAVMAVTSLVALGIGVAGRTWARPGLDGLAAVAGAAGLAAAGASAAPAVLGVARLLVGAAFLGAVTDAMLLGHWYLVQPGLPRQPVAELVRWSLRCWPFEVGLLLVPPGMMGVLRSGDDGFGGLLAWTWAVSALATLGLLLAARAALRERAYAAVMATTGLLYLAILTAMGTELIGRALVGR